LGRLWLGVYRDIDLGVDGCHRDAVGLDGARVVYVGELVLLLPRGAAAHAQDFNCEGDSHFDGAVRYDVVVAAEGAGDASRLDVVGAFGGGDVVVTRFGVYTWKVDGLGRAVRRGLDGSRTELE